jgi:hypothetical protein
MPVRMFWPTISGLASAPTLPGWTWSAFLMLVALPVISSDPTSPLAARCEPGMAPDMAPWSVTSPTFSSSSICADMLVRAPMLRMMRSRVIGSSQ